MLMFDIDAKSSAQSYQKVHQFKEDWISKYLRMKEKIACKGSPVQGLGTDTVWMCICHWLFQGTDARSSGGWCGGVVKNLPVESRQRRFDHWGCILWRYESTMHGKPLSSCKDALLENGKTGPVYMLGCTFYVSKSSQALALMFTRWRNMKWGYLSSSPLELEKNHKLRIDWMHQTHLSA